MATTTVTAPNSKFEGVRAGVRFVDGKGEVDSGDKPALRYFARHGYQVGKPTKGDDEAPAKSASKKAWVAYAVAQGADETAAEAMTRDELAEVDDFATVVPAPA